MHCPIQTVSAKLQCRPFGAFSQQSAQPGSRRDRWDRSEDAFASTKTQTEFFGFRQQTFLATFHGPGQRAAGANGIHPVEITEAGRLQNGTPVLDADKWSEGE